MKCTSITYGIMFMADDSFQTWKQICRHHPKILLDEQRGTTEDLRNDSRISGNDSNRFHSESDSITLLVRLLKDDVIT
jgi:hypothetical protein